MLTRELFILLVIISTVNQGITQKLNIAVFHTDNIKTVIFTPVSGQYSVLGDGIPVDSQVKDTYYITAENDRLTVRSQVESLGSFKKMEFRTEDDSGIFQLKPDSPPVLKREYDDDLAIISRNGNLQIINKINIEKYVSGVVETEGGPDAPLEYCKTQAILVRTYAIKNMYKHSGSGFSLCDDIHCQAYKGKSRNSLINKAVEETRGIVLTDLQNNPLTTPYHSNCGGETSDASDVWQKDITCLVKTKDPFCTQSPNAKWTKRIQVSDWEHYLRISGIYIENARPADYEFNQLTREKFYRFKNQKVLLTRIRDDWNLKSTFFSVASEGNILILKGKGFGHGVGLCQEGAIEMARVGYTFADILHFYFRNFRMTLL